MSRQRNSADALLLDGLELGGVEPVDLGRDDLRGGGQAAVGVRVPGHQERVDAHHRLEHRQARGLGALLEALEHGGLHLRVLAQVRVREAVLEARGALGLEHLEQFVLVALRQHHRTVELGPGVGAHAAGLDVDELRVVVRHVHPLQRHVLAALELHQVLLPVDDEQGAARREHADVPRVEPPVLVEVLCRHLGHLVVAGGHVVAAEPHLAAPRAGLAVGVHRVRAQVRLVVSVLELGLRVQNHLEGAQGRAGDADGGVLGHLDGGARARLGEAVPLHQRAVQRGAAPLLHLAADRAAARQARLEAPADEGFEGLEQNVEKGREAVLLERQGLHLDCQVDQEGEERALLGHLDLRARLDGLPHLGPPRHEVGLELLQAAVRVGALRPRRQRLRVRVADGVPEAVVGELGAHLQNVRERKVAQVDRPGTETRGELDLDGGDHGQDVALLNQHPLGVPRRPRRVHDHRDGLGGGRGRRARAGRSEGDKLVQAVELGRLALGHLLGVLGDLLRGAERVGVHHGLDRGHLPELAEHRRHSLPVADDGGDPALPYGLDDGVNAEGGVAGGHHDALGHGPLRAHHPVRRGLVVDQDAVVVDVFGVFGLGLDAALAEGGAELVDQPAEIRVAAPLGLAKHLGRVFEALVGLPPEQRPGSLGPLAGVRLVARGERLVERRHPGPQSLGELALPERLHAAPHLRRTSAGAVDGRFLAAGLGEGGPPRRELVQSVQRPEAYEVEEQVEEDEDQTREVEAQSKRETRHVGRASNVDRQTREITKIVSTKICK
mmetsp:Transcript_70526/g.159543  ORF Transcript_70526/g.159543 Transcript_70526/m.159543 type:complete len:781 (-) Transcript_70526:528-2870(-)